MYRLAILVTALFGFASCLTFKQELAEKLEENEQQLLAAIEKSINHGFDYNKAVYNELLDKVHANQKVVNALRDDVKQGEIDEQVSTFVDLEELITARLRNISPRETAKASAIYLAAMKDTSGYKPDPKLGFSAKKHISIVNYILVLEAYLVEHPNGGPHHSHEPNKDTRVTLNTEYFSLQQSMHGWLVPSFEDHYKVANRTRETIVKYRQQNMLPEVELLEENLLKFDNLTILLAREWPITTEEKVNTYYELSKMHYTLETLLETDKPFEKTIKQELLGILDGEDQKVEKAMDNLRKRSLDYFVNRLNLTYSQIDNVRQNVLQLPDNARKDQALFIMERIESLQVIVDHNIEHPAPDESLKASSLYLAAIKFVNKDTDNSPVKSTDLYEQVKKIVIKERSIIKPEMALSEKVLLLNINSELKSLRQVLKKMIENHQIPSLNDDEDLKKRTAATISKLNSERRNLEASRIQNQYGLLADKARILSSLLPIFNQQTLDLWYTNAQTHYSSAKAFESLLLTT